VRAIAHAFSIEGIGFIQLSLLHKKI